MGASWGYFRQCLKAYILTGGCPTLLIKDNAPSLIVGKKGDVGGRKKYKKVHRFKV